MGDFNYPQIDWNSQVCKSSVNSDVFKYLETTRDCFLHQHVQVPTHYRSDQTPNCLDLIFTNEEEMISEITTQSPIGKSHHLVLTFEAACYVEIYPSKTIKYCYDKANYDAMKQELTNWEWRHVLGNQPIDEDWNTIENKIPEVIEKFVPRKRHFKNSHKRAEWMDADTSAKIKAKNLAYQKYLKSRSKQDYEHYTRLRNQTRWRVRQTKKQFEQNIAKESKTNPKAFYNYARSKTKCRSGISDLVMTNGTMTVNNTEKADTLNNFFSSVFTPVEDTGTIPTLPDRSYMEPLTTIMIETDDVKKILDNLKTNKAAGPDGIHPRILKELASELAPILCNIYQRSLRDGILPKVWKYGHVTPIFKKGKKVLPNNYRPVSLTSIVCRVLEKLVRKGIVAHIKSLIVDEQHGFMEGRSCSSQLVSVLDVWTQILDKKESLDAVYLDFQKAFDTVPHQRLLTKLKAYGVHGSVHAWINSFLSQRKQRVVVNGAYSQWNDVTSGIPQRSVLGPTLVIIYINDLPETVESMVHIFADDTKIYRKIATENDCVKLQKDLDILQEWSSKWLLSFNAKKCKVMRLGGQHPDFIYKMINNTDVTDLEFTEMEKDLGIYVHNKLRLRDNAEIATAKANKILGLIRRSYEYPDAVSLKSL